MHNYTYICMCMCACTIMHISTHAHAEVMNQPTPLWIIAASPSNAGGLSNFACWYLLWFGKPPQGLGPTPLQRTHTYSRAHLASTKHPCVKGWAVACPARTHQNLMGRTSGAHSASASSCLHMDGGPDDQLAQCRVATSSCLCRHNLPERQQFTLSADGFTSTTNRIRRSAKG